MSMGVTMIRRTVRHAWSGLILVVLQASLAMQGAAQDAQSRERLRSYDDSLSAIADPAVLSAIERRWADSLRTGRNSPDLLLRLGLVRLRQAAQGGRPTSLAALEALDESAFRAPPDWPWPWYALARAKLVLADAGVLSKASMHQRIGESYRQGAFQALARSLQADSSFGPAIDLLAAVVLPIGDADLPPDITRTVGRSARTGGPGGWLALGRVHRNDERMAAALAAFERFESAGGSVAVAGLEQARELHALGRSNEAVDRYLRGVEAPDGAGRAAYRSDIAWIASRAELAAFDSLEGAGVGSWMRSFWANRDAAQLREPGERLSEHLRRWYHVHRNFRLPRRAEGGAPVTHMPWADGTDLPERITSAASSEDVAGSELVDLYATSLVPAARGGARILDDRAPIYMRHGEPDGTVNSIGRAGGVPAGISWKYNIAEEPLIFHFRCNAYCLLARFPVSLEGLIDFDARYEQLAAEMRSGRPGAITLTRTVQRRTRDIATGLTTDSHAPRFARQLAPLIQVFAVGDARSGTARALVTFAIPGERLVPVALPGGGTGYPLALRLIATHAAGEISRLDTIRYFRAADTLRRGAHLFGLAEVPLGPGVWDVRAVFSQPGTEAGGAAGRLGVVVPTGSALAVSDLVFGREGAGLTWRGPFGEVALNPLDAYPRDGTVEVYYEASGLRPGDRYRTTLRAEGESESAGGRVEIGFTDRITNTAQAFRRSIGLDRLAGGQYRLTLTIEHEESGTTATQSRLINVIGR